MSINFVTGNEGKFKEAQRIIPELIKLELDLVEIQEFDIKVIIEAKLNEAFNITKSPCIVEDTGLYFEGMNGFPGPFIKWMLKSVGNEGLYNLVNSTGNLKAYTKCYAGYINEKGEMYFFDGETKGKITSPAGSTAFGWNPIFIPEGSDKTFGEMSIEEKEHYSMRAIAFNKLKHHLENNK